MPPHGEPTLVFWGVRHERAEYGMAQKLSVANGRDDSELYVQSHNHSQYLGTIPTTGTKYCPWVPLLCR